MSAAWHIHHVHNAQSYAGERLTHIQSHCSPHTPSCSSSAAVVEICALNCSSIVINTVYICCDNHRLSFISLFREIRFYTNSEKMANGFIPEMSLKCCYLQEWKWMISAQWKVCEWWALFLLVHWSLLLLSGSAIRVHIYFILFHQWVSYSEFPSFDV